MAENNVHAEYIMAYEFQCIFTTEAWVGVWWMRRGGKDNEMWVFVLHSTACSEYSD